MKNKPMSRLLAGLVLTLLLGLMAPIFSYDYLIESLQSIIKRSTHILEFDVIEIREIKEEHNAPMRIVTLKVNELIVGKSIDPIIKQPFPITDQDDAHRPLTPKFRNGEKAIIHLRKLPDSTYAVLGHDQGKYEITGTTIEGSTISAEHFKQQIKEVYAGQSNKIDIPEHREMPVKGAGDYGGEGLSKLNGEFHLWEPLRYGPTSGTIQFRINPANAKDIDGNPLSFSDIKAAIDRAVSSWNTVSHSRVTFSVYSSSVNDTWHADDGVSTVTFESNTYLQNANGRTYEFYSSGIIDEVDILFHKDNHWNTDTTYPSSYTLYDHPVWGEIGPVDLEDVAAHELGHGVGLEHVGDSFSAYTLYPTNYEAEEWWEKIWRRSLAKGDSAGKIYQDPYFTSSATLQVADVLLAAPTTINFSGNLTIPNNYWLYVESGKTVQLNNAYIRCEGAGTISNSGTISGYTHYTLSGSDYKGYFPSSTAIASIVNWASAGWDIHLGSGTFSSSDIYMKSQVALYGNGINNTTIQNDIYFDQATQCRIEDMTVTEEITIQDNNAYVVGTEPKVWDVKAKKRILVDDAYSDLSGVIGETGNFYLSIISTGYCYCDYSQFNNSYNYGIYINSNGAEMELTNGVEIQNKNSYAIRATGYAFAFLNGGISFCSNPYDIYAQTYAEVDAQYLDEWSDCPPPVVELTGATIDITGNCNECGLGKLVAFASQNVLKSSESQLSGGDPGMDQFRQAMAVYREMRKTQREEYKSGKPYDAEKYGNQYRTIIGTLKNIVNEYNSLRSSILAMGKISKFYWALNEPQEVYNFLAGKLKDEIMSLHASRLLITYYLKVKDFQKAIETADRLIADYADAENVSTILHTKGVIYKYYLKNDEMAKEMFNSVVTKYPNSTLYDECQYELWEMGEELPKSSPAKEGQVDYKIMNYPNPFNATTKIIYALPESGQITITIFNTLGQQVRTLADGVKEAGKHEILWDGFDGFGNATSSGLYLARFVTDDKTQTVKIALVR